MLKRIPLLHAINLAVLKITQRGKEKEGKVYANKTRPLMVIQPGKLPPNIAVTATGS
jgi:hypothetical protein